MLFFTEGGTGKLSADDRLSIAVDIFGFFIADFIALLVSETRLTKFRLLLDITFTKTNGSTVLGGFIIASIDRSWANNA